MRSEKQVLKLVEEGWLQQGEKLQKYGGGDRERPHLGATIGGRHEAPYRPSRRATHNLDVDFGEARYPTTVVQQGRFHGDEWVHDPTIRGWIHADSPGRLAVECADQLVAAGPAGWFLVTDRRVAVVVDAAVVTEENAGAVEKSEDDAKGFGRFLGKARSAVNAVAELSESLMGGNGLVTLWECQRDRLTETGSIKGRSSDGFSFSASRFDDGSIVEVATEVHLKGYL
ncbi:hypothetical protein [Saccharopolyspora sp. 5N708]|uniref:hypothetical protein n=1 Tax=Saccharopolyspora sp. 5N708 TaxID=3457424 RepID=UPI003FD54AB9